MTVSAFSANFTRLPYQSARVLREGQSRQMDPHQKEDLGFDTQVFPESSAHTDNHTHQHTSSAVEVSDWLC